MKRLLPLVPLFFLLVIFLFLVMTIPFGDIYRLKSDYIEAKYKNGEVEYLITNKKPTLWTNYSAISPNVIHAIVISEDWGFYEHKGIDWNQLQSAFKAHFYHGDDLRGASTITQQLVKNLFLTSDRSYWRKIKEAMISLYIETQLPKRRILELYLNVIEYGEGIYGIRHASKQYFAKSPLTLTAREGAFLAMLLPNPIKYAISYRQKFLTPYAEMMINSILGKMKMARYLSEEELVQEGSSRFSWENDSSSLLLNL